IEQSETLRRKRSHLPHRVLNRENIPLTYIHGKNTRERTVAPGMWGVLPENRNLPVRTDHRGRMPENPLQVLFIHSVKYTRTASLVRNPEGGFSRILDCRLQAASLNCDLGKIFPSKFGIPIAARDDHILGITASAFETESAKGFRLDLRASGWILEPIP